MPTGKRFKKGAPVKFKHTYFRKDAIGNLDLIVRKTCPMLHKNMESELEDLVHELKSLKKERKDLELKIRGLKMATSTGKMDSAALFFTVCFLCSDNIRLCVLHIGRRRHEKA